MSRLRQGFPDVYAFLILIVLWLIFFWRLFTPIAEDQASLKHGDFSGQFVAFAGYQYTRFAKGEVPLWNPYNNGGFPFIADTQSAVFYPPRLITIALSNLAGGWSYNALQLEMTAHVLLGSLLMYLFMRRLTIGQRGSVFGSCVSSVILAYGGFTSSYPPLQLAILEAAIWLPLATLAILEATRQSVFHWKWLLLTGFALGISWMAGHPQTSWFLTYLLIAFLAYRVYQQRYGWRIFLAGTALFGIIAVGVTAVTLLPGLEYLLQTTRDSLGFDGKGNGFPFHDIAQFLLPGTVSQWSPLYVGIPSLILIVIAIRQRVSENIFWFGVFVVSLLLSFGANSAFYSSLYNLIPGLRFFRGQERAAFLIANSLAILAGLGTVYLMSMELSESLKYFAKRLALGLFGFTFIVAVLIFVLWLGDSASYDVYVRNFAFSWVIATATLFVLHLWLDNPLDWKRITLFGLTLIFDLFTMSMNSPDNYDSIAAKAQLAIEIPDFINTVNQSENELFRVDGFRGLEANYGSLYEVMDIRGISPLFLESPHRIIYADYINNPIAWELFGVEFVFSDKETLATESEIIAQGFDSEGAVNLHQLANPRPFVTLMYDAEVVDSDEFAFALLNDSRFDSRNIIILNRETVLDLPDEMPDEFEAEVINFTPEQLTMRTQSDEDAILSLALVDYIGWEATLDDEPVDILRAYGALSAIEVPDGDHTIQLNYNPLSYRLGAIISLITWGLLTFLALRFVIRR